MTHRKKPSVLNKELYKVRNTSKLIQNWCGGVLRLCGSAEPPNPSQSENSLLAVSVFLIPLSDNVNSQLFKTSLC